LVFEESLSKTSFCNEKPPVSNDGFSQGRSRKFLHRERDLRIEFKLLKLESHEEESIEKSGIMGTYYSKFIARLRI
jgi:hypothetical protein